MRTKDRNIHFSLKNEADREIAYIVPQCSLYCRDVAIVDVAIHSSIFLDCCIINLVEHLISLLVVCIAENPHLRIATR